MPAAPLPAGPEVSGDVADRCAGVLAVLGGADRALTVVEVARARGEARYLVEYALDVLERSGKVEACPDRRRWSPVVPAAFEVQGTTVVPTKGPRLDGLWWWSSSLWSGWAHPAEARAQVAKVLREGPAHKAGPWRRTAGSGPKWKGARCTCGWTFVQNGISKRDAQRAARAHMREAHG